MDKIIFIRYSELYLKGKNKKQFINILSRNINFKLKDLEYVLERKHDKMIIKNFKKDVGIFIKKLKEVIGISWFCVAKRIETEKEAIKKSVLQIVERNKFNTFRVSAKNNSEIFSNSMDLTHFVAGVILENTNMKVNLENHDVDVTVRVENNITFVYGEKIKGIDGLPSGSNGKALAFLSGGVDSPVAAYQMMTRGLQVDFITFLSPKVETEELLYKIKKLAKQVNKFNGKTGRLYIVNFQPVRHYIRNALKKESYRIVFLRRMFAHYGNFLSKKYDYVSLITGDSMGQVASQTPQNLTAVDDASDIFIARPLIGMDKNSIIKIARKIETYNISILPGEDMCSECTPKNPVLSADMKLVKELAKDLEPAFSEFTKVNTEEFTRKIIL